MRIDIRWTAGNPDDRDKYAAELVALTPDVIFASASRNVAALQRITRSVPIVFANVIDPLGAGFVASLARPGGNTTGFSSFEYSLSGKWLELLKEIAPNLTRVAVLRDPSLAAGIGQFAVIQALAPPSLGVELIPIDAQDPSEVERVRLLRRVLADMHPTEAMELCVSRMKKTKSNAEFLMTMNMS